MKKPKRTRAKRKAGSLTRLVSLSETNVNENAKRKIANLWLEYDGNEAKAILNAFKIGFEAGAIAQANKEFSNPASK